MYKSWLVEYLLKNKDSIRENISESTDESVDSLLGDDVYCMLLDVERLLKHLIQNDQVTTKELTALEIVSTRKSLNKLQIDYNINRFTLQSTFSELCFRIAFLLGYPYTDEGLLYYVKQKYKLNNRDMDKIKVFIESKHRFSVLRNEVQLERN